MTANSVFSAVDKWHFLKQLYYYLLNRAQKVKNGEELFLNVRDIMTMGVWLEVSREGNVNLDALSEQINRGNHMGFWIPVRIIHTIRYDYISEL